MGIFNDTETYVATTVSRVISDAKLPNSVLSGGGRAIMHKGDIPDNIMEELIHGVGFKSERLYDRASTDAPQGLPQGKAFLSIEGGDALQPILDTLEGATVTLKYSYVGRANLLHVGWMKLIADYGYDPATNELATRSVVNGYDTYLDDMVPAITSAMLYLFELGVLNRYGISPKAGFTPEHAAVTPPDDALVPHSNVIVGDLSADPAVRFTGMWEDFTDTYTEDIVIPIPDLDYPIDADYFHVHYTVGGVKKYWMYQIGTGTYPTLDSYFTTGGGTVVSTFLPWVYFRFDGVSEIEDKNTASYLANSRLVKYLGMDYDTIGEAIDDNPDIADVEQAIMTWSVPATTTNEIERRYLFEFFDKMHTAVDGDISPPIWGGPGAPNVAMTIQDNRFQMSLAYSALLKETKLGTVAAVNAHSSGVTDTTMPVIYWDNNADMEVETTIPARYHYYQRQISLTEYEEIRVLNMAVIYHVFGSYYTVGDDSDDILILPLDHEITETFSLKDKEELYARSLHFIINSVTMVELEWYETGLFQDILLIAAVVMTVASLGASFETIPLVLSLESMAVAALYILAEKVLEYLISMVVMKILVKVVGGDMAAVLVIIVTLYNGFQGMQGAGLKGAPLARELLQFSSGLVKAFGIRMQGMMQELQAETSEFSQQVKDQLALLETADGLLDAGNTMIPFTIFGEKPEDFYNRTIHSGNIGTLGISAISSYVDIALTLPTLDKSIRR